MTIIMLLLLSGGRLFVEVNKSVVHVCIVCWLLMYLYVSSCENMITSFCRLYYNMVNFYRLLLSNEVTVKSRDVVECRPILNWLVQPGHYR